ncbi:GSCOCT00011636001.3-RA-CDS [Cotesia congregata]|uniref:Ionotropic receptor 68a n=1 Tax=Cotesia congregata TaxID=51543 RepID=A0A8J2HAK0_COTCN|nr:GSCOCT00011636001.3-RA-CDS [Cotesia congregata]CAG5090866.1 Ionotropic receptor 68a [Cotesia congregata]
MVYMFDSYYQNLIHRNENGNLTLTYYSVFVRENEEFSPPQLTIQDILRNSKNSGCNGYVILITNGLQTMDLLQYAERERLLNIQGFFLMIHDSRLFYSNMKYLWNRIINVIFIRRHSLIRSQSGKNINYDWFNLETIQYPIPGQYFLRTYYVDTWYKGRFRYGKNHFANKVLDLSKKKLRVAIFEHIPAVTTNSRIFYKNYEKHNNKSVGIEFEIMKIIANKMNFKPIFFRPENIEITKWGTSNNNGSYDGLFGEAVEAKATFFLGDLHYTLRHYEILDLSSPYNTECLTFLTPESFTDNSWKLLINPFTLYTWTTIIFILLLVASIFRGFTIFYQKQILSHEKSNEPSSLKIISMIKVQEINEIYTKKIYGLSPFTGMQNCLLYTYSMLLQVSLPRLPEVWALRVFIGWWWLYTILITVTYRASLTATLANPIARITINTIADLAKSSLPVGGWDENYKDVFSSESDALLNKIGKNFELVNDEDEAISRVAKGAFAYYDNIYVLKEARAKRQLLESMQKNEALKNNKNLIADRDLHIMEECIIHMPISIGMIKNSPLKPQVDRIINRIVESGLVNKWLSDVMEWSQIIEIKSESNGPKALIDIRKLYGIFVALIIGYFLSFITMIAENLYWRFVTAKDPKYDKYRMDIFYSYKMK